MSLACWQLGRTATAATVPVMLHREPRAPAAGTVTGIGRDAVGGSVARRLCRAIGPDRTEGRRRSVRRRPDVLSFIGPYRPTGRWWRRARRRQGRALRVVAKRRPALTPTARGAGWATRSGRRSGHIQIEQRSWTKGRKKERLELDAGDRITEGIETRRAKTPQAAWSRGRLRPRDRARPDRRSGHAQSSLSQGIAASL
jgi:hypothetical protein